MRFLFGMLWLFTVALTVSPNLAQSDIEFEEHTLRHDGRARHYLLYVPSQVDGSQPVPLVFVLHGGGGNPDLYEEVTGFGEIAREEGFILVYPGGTGRLRNRLLTWNAGHCCGYAMEENVDDVGFFREMVTELEAEYNIDPARIYVAGHSNGAMMSYRLAAEMSDTFAAVGIVAGTIGGYATPDSDELIKIPQPENPVSVIHIHGMVDDNVNYYGGINMDGVADERIDLSVADSIGFWVEADQCEKTPQREERDGGMVIVETYACPATGTDVELISIVDSGHAWPGGNSIRRNADPNNQRVNAAAEIWAFFEAHPRSN